MNGDTLYEKRGRRYYPVAQRYDHDVLPFGSWLVTTSPCSASMCRVVEPARAEFLAAARLAHDAMVERMSKASELRPSQAPITQRQRDLLDQLEATGFSTTVWSRASLYEIADAGINAVEDKTR